jgi:hypothetical protein
MTEKASTKAKASRDIDYIAARRACSRAISGQECDLRAKLDDALKAGWSVQALKAYAFCVWQNSSCDYVTEAAWRLAVEFADSNGCSGGRDFPKRFSAEPERHSCATRHVAGGAFGWRQRSLMASE